MSATRPPTVVDRLRSAVRSFLLIALALAMAAGLSVLPANVASAQVIGATPTVVHTMAKAKKPKAPPTSTPTPTPTNNPAPPSQSAPSQPVTATPIATATTASNPSTSYQVSSAVKAFLSGLDISLGTGPVTGTLTGTVLTVAVGAPVLPVTLPIGDQALSFGGGMLSIDESTGTLTLSASMTASGGIGATLTVSIAHSGTTTLDNPTTADLTATVDITGVSLFGSTVDLSGTLSWTGGTTAASLTGTLTSDAVVAAGVLTIQAGTTITLSTADGLTVNGSAVLGSGPAAFTVTVMGAIDDLKNWSISVDDSTNPPSFSPIDGLTINPSFIGTVTDSKGVIEFDVSGSDVGSWTIGGAALALHHVEVSNQAVPTGLSCPAREDGQVWFDVQGTLTDPAAGIDAAAEGCVVPAAKAFTVSTTSPSDLLPDSAGFALTDATVSVTGQLADSATDAKGSVSITASATLTITAGLTNPVVLPVTVTFGSDGSFTASATVDLGALGLGAAGSTGTLILASSEIKQFDPTTVKATGDPFDLPAGITVLVAYTPTDDVVRALNYLKVPVPTGITARASLSTAGFSATIDLPFGSGDQGVKLFAADTPGRGAAYLNDLSLGVSLSAASSTLTVAGSAYLELPALYPGSTGSQVQVTLSGSLGVTANSVSVSIRFDIAGVNGPWTDAFGIPGLSVAEVAGQIGVEDSEETLGIPTPTLSFVVNDLQLPASWANAIGMVPGSMVSLSLSLDVDNPIVYISINGPTPGTVALEPFAVVKDVPGGDSVPQSVVDAVQLNTAQLLFAPFGGRDATGAVVNPGATLVFDATIAGQSVHVDGNVGLLPYPSLTADVSVAGFSVGPVSLQSPMLAITLKADPVDPVADFSFSGGFSDAFTGIQFAATVDEGLSMSLAGAAVSLHIAGGQPDYIQAGADLTGSVSLGAAGASFSASGDANLVIAGQTLGSVQFSYSTADGALWQQLQDSAAQVAQAFKNAYGWSDSTVLYVLRTLKYSDDQIAWGLTSAFNETAAQLTTVFYQSGSSIQTAVYEAQTWLGATDSQIASAMQQLNFGVTAIGPVLQSAFGDGQAAVYNALQSVGAAGSSAIDQLAGVFDSGAYSLSTHPWYSVPLLLDVSGGSQDPNAGVIQWVWDGGHNQQWFVLPTDSGYAELVNRNSGQCLSVVNNSYSAGDGLVQYPCSGSPNQQWYLGVYQGDSNVMGQTKVLTSRSSGLVADVSGASTSEGDSIDQWYYNGDWNQQWYFGPAVG